MDALRIRMEGGMERIEAATLQARRLSGKLARAAGPISGLFTGKRALAEEIAALLRELPAVEEAVDRLARMATAEGADPRVLREWRAARSRLGEKAARACEALAAATPSGSVREDLARVEEQLRSRRRELAPVPTAPLVPPPPGAAIAGDFRPQWERYRSHQGWGAIVNAVGPIAIGVLALDGATFGTIALFALWGAANLRWMKRMARWPCPSCGKPFAQWRVLFAPYCEHCGLRKFEGERPGRLGPGGPVDQGPLAP